MIYICSQTLLVSYLFLMTNIRKQKHQKMAKILKTVVFIGSGRDMQAFWGGDKRLGDRIIKYVIPFLEKRCGSVGDDKVEHDVTVFDPLVVFGDDGALKESGAELKHLHFFFKQGSAPTKMEEMRKSIMDADSFLVITPEYNHSVPPALASMIGHFGGSNYAYKPSGIITYSVGPWGGARTAVALRPLLSELGCLPVSKLCCFPSVTEIFNEDGTPKDPEHRILKQLPGLLDQLEWWTVACKAQRKKSGTP